MSVVYLPKGSLVTLNGTAITEHNRAPVAVTVERIENARRMANGTMRKYFIADKRSWSTSWSDLPELPANTVDNKGALTFIENLYNTVPGAFTMVVGANTYTVMFKTFNKTLKKRGRYDGYDVEISLEEV